MICVSYPREWHLGSSRPSGGLAFICDQSSEWAVEDIEAVDSDLKLHIPNLPQGLKSVVSWVRRLEQNGSSTPSVSILTSSSVILDAST